MKRWENNLVEWDLTKETYKANKDLCDRYGRDIFTW